MPGYKTVAVGAGLAALALTALPVASADAYIGQTARRHGDCTGSAVYQQTLRDVSNNPERLRVRFRVTNAHDDSAWTFRVYKNDDLVEKVFKYADNSGTVSITDAIAGSSHARVKITAHAGYGESCKSSLRLS